MTAFFTEHIAVYYATPARRRTIALIAANLVFFVALLIVMFYVRSTTPDWPEPFQFASMLMVTGMTLFALCAGVTAAVGAHAAQNDDKEPAVRWVAIAIVCWLTFLFLEIVEWVRLVYQLELGPRTPFGGTFLMLTGMHWLATVACTCWFMFVAADVKRRDVYASALYSHFLALWWIVLVITLYLVNSHPTQGLT